jgi:hypothetical protein
MAISSVMTVLRSRGVAPALLSIALLVAGCGTATPTSPATAGPTASPSSTTPASLDPAASPTPAASADNAALYAQIEEQVIKLRGLQPKSPVVRNVVDVVQLHDVITRIVTEQMPAEFVRASETLYKGLLLMPQDASLESLLIELYSTQAIGLYDPDTKQLYVVSKSGAIGGVEKVTYAHEYTHALQDQVYDLKSITGEAKDQSDRSLARMTLVEGDAYVTMALWMQANLTAAEKGEVAGSADPASEAALAKLPEIVRQSMLFPATAGIGLALADFGRGGFAAIDQRFGAPPDTTEQILHADKLASAEKPVAVTFPADLAARLGTGWKVSLQDTLGEMQLEILLREGGATTSKAAAAGWGGDRVALLEGPGGAVGVVLDTTWDTEADAVEFSAALDPLVAKLKAAGRSAAWLMPEPGRVVLVTGSSDDVLGRVANVLGLAQ